MVGALLVGLVTGTIARMIFAKGLGIGDDVILDWAGILGSIIGAVIVLFLWNWIVRAKRLLT